MKLVGRERIKSVGRTPLSLENHILWDKISMEINNFERVLYLVDDEQALVKTCSHICSQLKEELELIPIKNVENIINITNGASKV